MPRSRPGLSMGGWGVALDGKPVRTPAKHELAVPSEALAAAIAAEWDAQREDIRPATMPLTRLAATAIDRTAAQRDLVVAETANYAGTDLVCYRAEPAGAGGAPARGLATADRLGGAALRRGARGHHRDRPGRAIAGGAPGLCRDRRGAGRFPPDRAAHPDGGLGLAGHRARAPRRPARRRGGLRRPARRDFPDRNLGRGCRSRRPPPRPRRRHRSGRTVYCAAG